jgi:dihydrolipoamide dehydrogenase
MEQQDKFDVIIIGGGQAGYITAIQAAHAGLTTALIEKNRIGGSYLLYGAVPIRSLLESAFVLEKIRNAKEFGIKCGTATADWKTITLRAVKIATKLSKYIELKLLRNKVSLFKGRAYLSNQGEVTFVASGNNVTITGKNIIIATGTAALPIPGVSFDDSKFISPAEILQLPEIPKRILIIGANGRGVELANLFKIFGSQVTLIEKQNKILPTMDIDVCQVIRKSLEQRDITIHTEAKVTGVIQSEEKYQYIIEKPEGSFKISPDTCIITEGMKANTSGLALEDAGVKTMNSFIRVDGHLRTNISGIYATGNCVGPPRTLHAVRSEAACIIDSITRKGRLTVNMDSIPTCVYSQPEAASMGMSEAEAIEAGYNIKTSKVFNNTNSRTVTIGENEGFVKLIIDADNGILLGAHIVGHSATELISEIALFINMKMPAQKITTIPHSSPTLSEAIVEAAWKIKNG